MIHFLTKVSKHPYFNYLLILIGLFPICFYFTTVYNYATNVPIVDDYVSIIRFLNNYSLTQSMQEKIILLFKPQNMHKIMTSKVITASVFHLEGHGNLRTMVIIGNLFLIPTSLFFYFTAKEESKMKPIYFVLLLFIFFNFHYYSFIFFPTVPMQFGSSTALILATLFFLVKNKYQHQIIATLLLIISLLSSSNALILIPIGIMHHIIHKNRKHLIHWIIFSTIAIFLYRINNTGINQGNGKLLMLVKQPIMILEWFFIMLGSCFAIRLPIDITLSKLFGIILTLLYSYIFFFESKKLIKQSPLSYYSFIFFLLTSIMISLVRASSQQIDAINYRYRFISTLLLISFIILAYPLIKEKFKNLFFIATFTTTILVYYTSMTHYGRIERFTNELKQNMLNYIQDETTELHFPNQKIAKEIINKSIKLRVYKPPIK